MEPGIYRAAAGAVIINDKNEVLLTQRSLHRDHHAGEWEISTGRLNQGESFEEAITREVQEELQIKIEIIVPLQTFHFYRGEERIEHVGITFLTKHIEGDVIVDGVEEVAFEWLKFDDAINRVNDNSIKSSLISAKAYLKA
jgi:8-oxo-dGTP diphosphatase